MVAASSIDFWNIRRRRLSSSSLSSSSQLLQQRDNTTICRYNSHNNFGTMTSTAQQLLLSSTEKKTVLYYSTGTSICLEKETKEAAGGEGALEGNKTKAGGEEEERIPSWQNPRLHKNPEKQKIFFDQFKEGEEIKMAEMPGFEESSGAGAGDGSDGKKKEEGKDGDDSNNNDHSQVLAPSNVKELGMEILHLNMLEMNELVNKIGDHFNIVKPPYHNESAGGGGGGDDDDDDDDDDAKPKEEERTVFDIKLVGFDKKSKIKVIKEVRAMGGLGLKEAKELVESAPKIIQKDMKKDACEEMKAKLEALGATVEIV